MSSSSTVILSPWKKLSPNLVEPPVVSLGDIMSEELAQSLQDREEKELKKELVNITNTGRQVGEGSSKDAMEENLEDFQNFDQDIDEADCTNDYMLAQYLQMEFDREHDRILSREEEKFNGNDKVKVSFEKYRTTHPYVQKVAPDSSEDEDEDGREYRHHRIDTRQPPKIGPSGVIRTNDRGYVTKHDKVICGRRNTSNMLEFPPEFQTGDAAKTDMQLSNHVYNKLKTHSISEEKRHRRLHEKKERSTAEMALDANTRLVLYKFVNGGLLESINGAVATGKESTVFHAFGGSSEEEEKEIPAECAVKVFKTTLNEFKNRIEYVKDDYRFKNPRKVLKVWAEREMMNLSRMQRAGIRCPSVVKLKKHVLVMSFIGEDGCSAPKLKDASMDEEQLHSAYDQCVQAISKMYTSCQLVHGDLSEFNILYHQGECWIIDVSQSMDTSHPRALVFLARDCRNLTEFFRKRGLEVPSPRQLFNEVTGLSMESDENFYTDVQKYAAANRSAQRTQDKKRPADCLLRQVKEERDDDAEAWEDDEDFIDY